MIEHTQGGGTMFTGSGVTLLRMITQLGALKLKVKCGMEMRRGSSIVKQIKTEYGLKGNAAKLFEQFEKIVEAAKEKELHVVEVVPGKFAPLPLDKKPDFIYWPTEQHGNGWKLGKVVPDVKGHYLTARFVEGPTEDAEAYCLKEAAARGINQAQVEAAVESSMFPADYFHILNFKADLKAAKKKGGRRGTNRAN